MQENSSEIQSLSGSALGEISYTFSPRPNEVRYNDWRLIEMPTPKTFVPYIPVSVIIPYCDRPEELARTLASLERQTYPRSLFEVVVVDDGSQTPLVRPEETLLNIKVVHQDDRGYGVARARNNGVREAAHDILVFLDCDVLVESGWLAAHARWHHVVQDGVTIGFHFHVPIEGVDADTIRLRPGSLAELFSDRNASPSWIERHMVRTDDLTLKADDIFRVVLGGNMGIGRKFYELVGGYDESFTQWGGEDTEFGYRAYTHGGLLVPVRDAVGWHQGAWTDGREDKERSLQQLRGKLCHQIAHSDFREWIPGRSYKVPTYVVTISVTDEPVERVMEAIENLLADALHDLVVFVDMPPEREDLAALRHQFGPDPRVRVGASGTGLEAFPVAPFHVTIPAAVSFLSSAVRELHERLSAAVLGTGRCDNGMQVSIARAWAMHRANRTGKDVADFGDVVTIPNVALGLTADQAPGGPPRRLSDTGRHAGGGRLRTDLRRLRVELKKVRNPSQAWRLLRTIVVVLRWRLSISRQRGDVSSDQLSFSTRTSSGDSADYSLGADIVALGERARAVFRASPRVAHAARGQHVDVVVADNSTQSFAGGHATVLLSEAPIQYSVPAFDPWQDNPINWVSDASNVVATLGPRELLPPDSDIRRVVDRNDRTALKAIYHLEDVHAFHQDVLGRAGELARLAANGVVVRLADRDSRLAEPLGAELFELMTRDSRTLDLGARELLSIRMRRAALRDHSLRSRARQLCGAVLTDPPQPPLVSILMVTRRPSFLSHAVDAVARQTYPRLELVLALHGGGFDECSQHLDKLNCPTKVVRLDQACPLGEALNAAVKASSGSLLSKMDDDDLYDCDHLWDLVLAHEYSRASLVGKAAEYVYLAASDRTVRRFSGGAEDYRNTVAGGALLIARNDIDRVGGWRPVPHGEDRALLGDVIRAGGRIYRTHGCGYVLVRHGHQHAWEVEDEYFLKEADTQSVGWDPALVDFTDAVRPPAAAP